MQVSALFLVQMQHLCSRWRHNINVALSESTPCVFHVTQLSIISLNCACAIHVHVFTFTSLKLMRRNVSAQFCLSALDMYLS